ncbi:MAG TPA: hypothetical protein DD381_04830 [Lentisphaeria bacterium]|nr:MAG: hypothetical protein A2X47_01740 [Lentisphaerae bacterium GWF2_38_69]HBM15654.1 hypothetical protein [Lentisphaeria bacterium]
MRKTLLIVFICIILLSVIFWWVNEGVPVTIGDARKGTISSYIEERGKTTLPRQYLISMPTTGKIMPIELKASMSVKKGEVVAIMNQGDLNTSVEEAQAKVDAIKRQIVLNKYNEIEKKALEEAEKWIKVMADTVESALRKVQASDARNKYAQWNLQSTEQMEKSISKRQIYRAQMEAAESKVQYESDQFSYSAMKTIHAISTFLPLYIKMYLTKKSLEGAVLQANLNEAEAVLEKVKRDLENGTIRSPVDGVVLKRYVENERYLSAGTKLLEIGDMKTLQVRSDILSVYASEINLGDEVDIFGSAIGSIPIKGKVLRIHPKGFTQISSLGVREERIPIDIEFASGELDKLEKEFHRTMGVGYRVEVRIYTDKAENAVIIPHTALFRGSGNTWQIFVADGRTADLRTVKIGLLNDYEAQIISGIVPGEKVIIAPPSTIRDADRISIDT